MIQRQGLSEEEVSVNHHCVLKPDNSLSILLIEINEYHSLRAELELIHLFLLFKYSLEISVEISDAKLRILLSYLDIMTQNSQVWEKKVCWQVVHIIIWKPFILMHFVSSVTTWSTRHEVVTVLVLRYSFLLSMVPKVLIQNSTKVCHCRATMLFWCQTIRQKQIQQLSPCCLKKAIHGLVKT